MKLLKITTFTDLISEFGEIPLCLCNCGQKVNVKPNKKGSYRYYLKCGYPKYVQGHNKPTLGKKLSIEACKNMKLAANRLEVKEKKSKTHLGKIVSLETKEKQRKAKLGKKQLPELTEKIRQANLGKKRSPEICKKIKQIQSNPEVKEKIRKAHIERLKDPKNNPMYGKKGKLCPNYGHVRYHSKQTFIHLTPLQGERKMHRWEHLYATYLDSIGELYLYELQAFEMNIGYDTTYTPDFFLPLQNKFIEIKGYWRDDAKLKSDKFIELYSKDYNYEILYKIDLKNLGIKL